MAGSRLMRPALTKTDHHYSCGATALDDGCHKHSHKYTHERVLVRIFRI